MYIIYILFVYTDLLCIIRKRSVFMETLIKMEGIPENVLNLLIDKGYFKTKTETIRAGILALGEKYGILSNPEELELGLVALRIKKEEAHLKAKGRKFLTESEVKKKYRFK